MIDQSGNAANGRRAPRSERRRRKDVLQLWLAVVTVIVAIGGLVFALNGQLRDDLREVRDEVRAFAR